MTDKYKELLERLDGVKHEIGFVGLALGEGYAWAAKVLEEAAAAIEDLSEQNDNLREVADTANEYADHLLNVKRHESCTDCPLYDKDKHRCPRFNAVIPRVIEEALDELPSAQPEQRWTPVSKGLPKEDREYNVTIRESRGVKTPYEYVTTLRYGIADTGENDVFYIEDSERGDAVIDDVIAWAPLPSPYREKE